MSAEKPNNRFQIEKLRGVHYALVAWVLEQLPYEVWVLRKSAGTILELPALVFAELRDGCLHLSILPPCGNYALNWNSCLFKSSLRRLGEKNYSETELLVHSVYFDRIPGYPPHQGPSVLVCFHSSGLFNKETFSETIRMADAAACA